MPLDKGIPGDKPRLTQTMDKPDEFSFGGLCTLVAFFGAPPFVLYAAHDMFVHGYLSTAATVSQKVYYLVMVAGMGAVSITSLLAGVETLRGGVRQPFRWVTGALILFLFVASYFHPSGPGL